MKLKSLSFDCGTFSVTLSGNGYVIPGGKSNPFGPQMIPIRDINDAAGLYRLGVTADCRTICDALVHVVWVSAAAEQGPYLAFKCDDDTGLPALRAQQGKPVQLKFTLCGDGNPAATGSVR